MHYLWRNNMHFNRHQAARLFEAGWTPAEIAAQWPRIWRCSDGKLGCQPWIRENTRLTMAGVERAIADGPPARAE